MSFAKIIVVTHCARAVYTARVPVHGTYTAVYTVQHGPYAAVYTARSRQCTQPCTHAYVYTAITRRVRAIYTAVYTASIQLYTRAMYTARIRFCKCSCTRAVYTAAYTARSQPVHGSVYGRVRRPSHGHPTHTCIRLHGRVHTHTCTPPLQGRVHDQYTFVYMAGRPTRRCTPAETARYGRGPCTRL